MVENNSDHGKTKIMQLCGGTKLALEVLLFRWLFSLLFYRQQKDK